MRTGRSTKSKSGEKECSHSACPYHQSSYTRLNLSSGVPDRIIRELVQVATIRLLQRKGIVKFPVKFTPTNKLLGIEKRVKKSNM